MANVHLKVIIFILILKCNLGYADVLHTKDSVSIYLKKSDDKTLPINEKISIVDSIYYFSVHTENDILKSEALKQYIKLYYHKKDWDLFNKYRREHLRLTNQLNDSIAQAKTLEYSGYYYKIHHQIDSAYYFYYKGYKIYSKLQDSLRAGKVLINLAILQKNTHDYVGSEATSFQALNYLESSDNKIRISSLYNNLGIIYEQLNDKDNAIKYHTKALVLRKQIKGNTREQLHSYNNLGVVYMRNSNYDKAIKYFKKALVYDSILQNDRLLKSYIIDNYTYSLFKKGETYNILNSLLETLSIRDEENDLDGIVINCIHLAEYYNEVGDKKTALVYAKRAEEISETIQNYHDYLKSIEVLSSLQDSKEAKDTHFKKYIVIRDSLDKVARYYKEHFARIRFETDEKEQIIRKQEGEIEEKQNTILFVSGVTILIIISIVFFYSYKRRTQQKLRKELMNGFKPYLINKYSLTPENFDFWEILSEGLSQDQISEKLHISIDAIKSRRRSLKSKINKVEKIDGNFDKTKAVILYNQELELYKNHLSKKGK